MSLKVQLLLAIISQVKMEVMVQEELLWCSQIKHVGKEAARRRVRGRSPSKSALQGAPQYECLLKCHKHHQLFFHASKLAHCNKRSSLTCQEINSAARLQSAWKCRLYQTRRSRQEEQELRGRNKYCSGREQLP